MGADALQARLPTRLVDVGSENQDPFLFETKRGHAKDATWVALSHCWGKKRPLMTELRTLEDRYASIPLHTMPPLFKDAVIITRELGCRYLWIDCLCIIQDCPEDWATESADMCHIYKNCHFTIAVEGSQDSSIGIFESSNSGKETFRADQCKIQAPVYYSDQSGRLQGKIFFGTHPEEDSARPGFWGLDILSTRAWTLQETILPPRTLRYMKGCFWWECRATQLSERETSAIESKVVPNAWKLNVLKTIVRDSYSFDYYNGRELWYMLVNEYCRRDITFEEDRFPAISAAAKECQRHLGHEYKAGLWYEDIYRSLTWSVWGPGAERPSTYIAPSWSWGRLNLAAIKKKHNSTGSNIDNHDTYKNATIYKDDVYLSNLHRTRFADVINDTVENVEQDPFSRGRNGTLWIWGPCLNICRCNVPIPYFDCHEYNSSNDQCITRLTRGGYKSTTRKQFAKEDHGKCWRWDTIQGPGCTKNPGCIHEELTYLHIMDVNYNDLFQRTVCSLALILKLVSSDKADTYERIGLAQLMSFDDRIQEVQGHGLWLTKELIII